MGGIFKSIDISATGLNAQRTRMDIISENIANANTTRTPQGGPYKRKDVVFSAVLDSKVNPGDPVTTAGVKIDKVTEDPEAVRMVYNPSHPDADERGYVMMPDINPVTEMTNMISATRSYEANVTALNSSKSMFLKALEIGKR